MSTEQNKEAVRKFADAFNRQDMDLLAKVSTSEVAQEWSQIIPQVHRDMNEHRIDIIDMVAEGDMVAVRMATSGYHSGEIFGIPATGKQWTNRVWSFMRFVDGKVAEVDALPDVENHIKQLGGVITVGEAT